MPTITRKLQNTGATGGCALGKASRPLISASLSCARMMLPSLGTWIAKSVRPSFSLGQPNSVSGALFSVCQMASIAAILAGWCASVFSPCMSPARICSGIAIAAATTPARSALRVPPLDVPRSNCQAESPATRKAAVSVEASSLCVRRYGNEGLKITSSQLVAWKRPSMIS